MKRGQISMDLLFAVALMSITVLGLIGLSSQQVHGAGVLDATAKLKVYSINLRDTVVKAYSMGGGIAVREDFPFTLSPGDSVNVTLNASSRELVVTAFISGEKYRTVQSLPIPLASDSKVELNSNSPTLWIVTRYNETAGMVDVRLSKSP